MKEVKPNHLGIQECPYCPEKTELRLVGAWKYNGRIYTDIFLFTCPRCSHNFTGNASETEKHQDGIEARKHLNEAKDFLQKANHSTKIELRLSNNKTITWD